MGSRVRITVVGLVAGLLLALAAPASQAAAAGIARFFAANCKVNTCENQATPAEELERAKIEGFTQAGGHPNFGITDFAVQTTSPTGPPTGLVNHIRTDVAPGVSTNPQAVPKCTMAEFGFEVAPGIFTAPSAKCQEESEIGVNKAVVYAGFHLPLEGKVYNLVQPKGLASDFGVALPLPEAITKSKTQLYAHTLIEGNVEWGAEAEGTGKADYHDLFNISVSTALPLISSRLIFNGRAGNGLFLTNPTSCTGTGPQTTTKLKLSFEGGEVAEANYTSPIGVENCGLVPFEPGFALFQGTVAPDSPDGVTTELSLPHPAGGANIDDSQVKTATVTLPEGLTLNPSAAAGLEACTPEEIGIGTKNAVACPEGSRLGTVTLDVPGLPDGSLQGYAYLGENAPGPITGPPYVIYVATESERYGVTVRIKGNTTPDETTGQLTASFTENPEQPFSNLKIKFNGGPLAPLANGLTCEAGAATTSFVPFSGTAAQSPMANFEINGCPSPIPFSPAQSTENETPTAGGHTAFTFSASRANGNQYLKTIRTTLPAGLIGSIPTVALCSEAQATAGTCPSSSKIGTVTVAAGAGSSPYTFYGSVYMTGPYNGAPYGMSIVVPAIAGPFNLGLVVTRATVRVDPNTARVTIESTLPTIFKGVPLRLRSVSVDVNRQGFLYNPTSCSPLQTETLFGSTASATSTASSPLQLTGCAALPFKPVFAVQAGGKPSKVNGASLTTTITQAAGQAAIRSVFVSLPLQLPSRLTTLHKACLQATFEANPLSCGPESKVGTATAVTPALPAPLTGPAILVSHGGEEFPELDLVLEGDNGIRVILVGKTDIKKGITTSNFATNPDTPLSSFKLSLPMGPHSLLGAYGSLCRPTLVMPTTITGQNGTVIKQSTKISPVGCPVQIVAKKVIGHRAYLTIKTFAAGRITATGSGVRRTSRSLSGARRTVSLVVPINGRRGTRFSTTIRVSFAPRHGNERSSATTRARFR